MRQSLLAIIIGALTFMSVSVNAGSLSDEAGLNAVNPVCQSHLEEVEKSYNLNGLNLTFFHTQDPSSYPSLHTSTEKYENGASFFSTTLSPDGERCYISIVKTTIVNNQRCSAIVEARLDNDSTLVANSYVEGNYIHLYPESGAYQMLLVGIGEDVCAITETRMMWPDL